MSTNIIELLEAERDRINSAINALRNGSGDGRRNGKRHMSVAARRKIADAARRRWARVRKEAKASAQAA